MKAEVDSMFIGRERELTSLKEFYEKDGIGMTVIYGRRRIGKSTLITEFVKDKKTIFYTATKVGKNRNLELFSKQVVDLLMPGVENIRFHTTEAVFDFIDKNIGDEKLVLVIDELPYWAERDEALLSILQKYMDTVWNDKSLKVIYVVLRPALWNRKYSVKRVPCLEDGIPRSNWRHLITWMQQNLFRSILMRIRQSVMELPVALQSIFR